MGRNLTINLPSTPVEMLLTNGAVNITENMLGIHPNCPRTILYSQMRTDASQVNLYSVPFQVVRSHDSGFNWAQLVDAQTGAFVWDRMHQLLDPLIASGKKIIYVIQDTPITAVCGNIKQRWRTGRVEVTGNSLSNMVFPTVANRTKFMYEPTTAGTGGTSEPAWPTTVGATVNAVGGTAVYTCRDIPSGATFLAWNSNINSVNSTTKAGDVSYKIAGSTMPADSTLVAAFVTALCTEFSGAIYAIEFGNEPNFKMVDNNVLPGWPAFNMSDAETFVSNAWAAKNAIAALPAATRPIFGGCGWVNNLSSVENLKLFLEAKDPVTNKFGYELDFDYHSFHNYGSVDLGNKGSVNISSGNYANIRSSLSNLNNVLADYGIRDAKWRVTEYGTLPATSGTVFDAFMAMSTADELTVLKMRLALAMCLPNCIGIDLYSWTGDFNGDLDSLSSPITQATTWLSTIKTINWATQNRSTGTLTLNLQLLNGSNVTEIYNYPASWPNYYW